MHGTIKKKLPLRHRLQSEIFAKLAYAKERTERHSASAYVHVCPDNLAALLALQISCVKGHKTRASDRRDR